MLSGRENIPVNHLFYGVALQVCWTVQPVLSGGENIPVNHLFYGGEENGSKGVRSWVTLSLLRYKNFIPFKVKREVCVATISLC